MRLRGVAPAVVALTLALELALGAQAATLRLYSYDPADQQTRDAAGALTFAFRHNLLSNRVVRVLATEGQASADLAPAGEAALGPGGLKGLLGMGAPERDLYEVRPGGQGAALIAAFCPGSNRAWMAMGRLRAGGNLRVLVLGAPAGGPARLCRSLDFTFHGEWRAPPGPSLDPHQFDPPVSPRG